MNRGVATSPIVALTGFMAAGKSSVARALGKFLRWNCFDLDFEIERRENLSVREIFQVHGEPRFREIETEALRSVLSQAVAPTVIALGGGTSVQPQNAQLLRRHGAHVVFLEVDVEQLLQRCCAASSRCAENPRPLARDADAFRALYAQRLPQYRKATLTVNTEGKSIDKTAREIAVALHLPARSR
ncbi:MAG: shikimate kinase [Candidatus Korobacteraceae bacterium]